MWRNFAQKDFCWCLRCREQVKMYICSSSIQPQRKLVVDLESQLLTGGRRCMWFVIVLHEWICGMNCLIWQSPGLLFLWWMYLFATGFSRRGKRTAGRMKSLMEAWLCQEKSGKSFTSKGCVHLHSYYTARQIKYLHCHLAGCIAGVYFRKLSVGAWLIFLLHIDNRLWEFHIPLLCFILLPPCPTTCSDKWSPATRKANHFL